MSLHSNALHIIVAAMAVGSTSANAALSITTVSQATRPSSATYGAEQISGITYAGGDQADRLDEQRSDRRDAGLLPRKGRIQASVVTERNKR